MDYHRSSFTHHHERPGTHHLQGKRRIVAETVDAVPTVETDVEHGCIKNNDYTSVTTPPKDISSDIWVERQSSLFGLEGQGCTWMDLKEREETRTISNRPVFGPPIYRVFYNMSIFSNSNRFYSMRGIIVFVALLFPWIGLTVLYLYMDMNAFFFASLILGTGSYFSHWYSVYVWKGIRQSDGRPGTCLRVFYMLNDEERLLLSKQYDVLLTFFTVLYAFAYSFCFIYAFIRWHDMPIWGPVIIIIWILTVCIPQFASWAVIYIFFASCDTAAQLIRKQKIFVYNYTNTKINWRAVQQNFDICECVVNDISTGFQPVFITCVSYSLVCASQTIGLVSQWISWRSANYQPTSEVFIILAQLGLGLVVFYMFFASWWKASQVTSACDEILDQCNRTLSLLRMEPNFEESPEDYEKAEMFHRYVERAQLGFKAFNIRISFSLGVAILTPILSLLSVFVPVFLRQVYSN